MLSPHFHLAEFNEHTGRRPPARSRPALVWLCKSVLELLRDQYGPVTIISGYRSRAYNTKIGGAPHSHHIYDEHLSSPAADIACERGQPRDWYLTLDRLGVGGLGLYDRHVHVDLRRGRARW